MTSSEEQLVYLVNVHNDPVLIKINGRANYLNCAPVRELFKTLIREGKHHYVIDFSQCAGMDSTFLGIMAGAILELRKCVPPGTITLCHLGTRNLELINNVGLNRLLVVASECEACTSMNLSSGNSISIQDTGIPADNALILEAHQSLIHANRDNLSKFQDVVSFLKKELEGGGH
jgi:anti-anti-sigma regulatory factor